MSTPTVVFLDLPASSPPIRKSKGPRECHEGSGLGLPTLHHSPPVSVTHRGSNNSRERLSVIADTAERVTASLTVTEANDSTQRALVTVRARSTSSQRCDMSSCGGCVVRRASPPNQTLTVLPDMSGFSHDWEGPSSSALPRSEPPRRASSMMAPSCDIRPRNDVSALSFSGDPRVVEGVSDRVRDCASSPPQLPLLSASSVSPEGERKSSRASIDVSPGGGRRAPADEDSVPASSSIPAEWCRTEGLGWTTQLIVRRLQDPLVRENNPFGADATDRLLQVSSEIHVDAGVDWGSDTEHLVTVAESPRHAAPLPTPQSQSLSRHLSKPPPLVSQSGRASVAKRRTTVVSIEAKTRRGVPQQQRQSMWVGKAETHEGRRLRIVSQKKPTECRTSSPAKLTVNEEEPAKIPPNDCTDNRGPPLEVVVIGGRSVMVRRLK